MKFDDSDKAYSLHISTILTVMIHRHGSRQTHRPGHSRYHLIPEKGTPLRSISVKPHRPGLPLSLANAAMDGYGFFSL